jgi:hypothetical protein
MDAKLLAEALKNLDAQSFRPGDSLLASTINHPVDAVGEFGNWLTNRVNTAAGIPDQYDNPYPLLAPQGQEQAAFDIAGMAQLGSMPFAPKSAGGTLGTLVDYGAPETQFSRAHKIAQQNAVDMLWLPPDNTAMDRALAMGFDVDAYHGTASVFPEFLKEKATDKQGRKLGMGWGKDKFYFADTGGAASGAASGAEYFGKGDSQNVIPSMLFMKKPIHSDEYMGMVDDLIAKGKSRDSAISAVDKIIKKQGYDGINSDVGGLAVFEPNQIRSRFAAFDPAKKDSSDLLASYLLPATMLGYGMANQDKNPLAEALRNGY